MNLKTLTTRPATPATGTPRAANIALWISQILTAAVYIGSALAKLAADPTTAASFAAMGVDPAGMTAIAVLEILGAVALLIPRLAGLAGLAFVGLMVGAVAMTVLTHGIAMAATPAVVGLLAAVIAWGRRRSVVALIATVRGH